MTPRRGRVHGCTHQEGNATGRVGAHDTGSVSATEAGVIALWPPGHGPIARQVLTPGSAAAGLGPAPVWESPAVVAHKPASLGQGFRDPSRALKMPDGHYYVAVGSGFGGTGPNSNNQTGLPDSGTGCMAWMKAADASLQNFTCKGFDIVLGHP